MHSSCVFCLFCHAMQQQFLSQQPIINAVPFRSFTVFSEVQGERDRLQVFYGMDGRRVWQCIHLCCEGSYWLLDVSYMHLPLA